MTLADVDCVAHVIADVFVDDPLCVCVARAPGAGAARRGRGPGGRRREPQGPVLRVSGPMVKAT